MEKEKSIPMPPSPIPMFPKVRIQEDNTVIRSFPVREIKMEATAYVTKYIPMNPDIPETVSWERVSSPILIFETEDGWSLFFIDDFPSL